MNKKVLDFINTYGESYGIIIPYNETHKFDDIKHKTFYQDKLCKSFISKNAYKVTY